MEDLYINFTMSIAKLNKIIQKIKSFEMNKYGLQPIHASCIYYLIKNPQGLTAKELCEFTLEDKAAISRALQVMQSKGYVEYIAHGRNEIIKITNDGKTLSVNIQKRINSAVNAASVSLTEEERPSFYKSLSEIYQNLINYYQTLIKSED